MKRNQKLNNLEIFILNIKLKQRFFRGTSNIAICFIKLWPQHQFFVQLLAITSNSLEWRMNLSCIIHYMLHTREVRCKCKSTKIFTEQHTQNYCIFNNKCRCCIYRWCLLGISSHFIYFLQVISERFLQLKYGSNGPNKHWPWKIETFNRALSHYLS